MGRLHLTYLHGRIYTCKYCQTHLALIEDVVSKQFHCRHGKAYLFNKVKIRGHLAAGTHCECPMNLPHRLGQIRIILELMFHQFGLTFGVDYGTITGYPCCQTTPQVKVVDFDGTNFWVNSEAQVDVDAGD